MEILGKLKVFQLFSLKKLEKPNVFTVFQLKWPGHAQTRSGIGPEPGSRLIPPCMSASEAHRHFDTSTVSWSSASLLKKAVMPSQAHQQKKTGSIYGTVHSWRVP